MQNNGFLYISSGKKKFTLEAMRSARSLKSHCKKFPVTLITDYLHEEIKEEYSVFDEVRVEKLLNAHNFTKKFDWGSNVFKKIFTLSKSPYKNTILLDTDTIIRSNKIKTAFDMLKSDELIITKASKKTSNSAKLLSEEIYDTGFLAYQSQSPNFKALMNKWIETLKEHQKFRDQKLPINNPLFPRGLSDNDKAFLLSSNQVGLATHLRPNFNPLGIKVRELPAREWNHHSPEEHEAIIVDANPLNKFQDNTRNSFGLLSPYQSPISKTVLGLSLAERQILVETIRKHAQEITGNVSGTKGLRVDDIFSHSEPSLKQLKEKIEQHYIALFKEQYFKRGDIKRSINFRIHAWAYILSSGGYISPHQHTSAMISGTYYVSIPKQISIDRAGGAIEIYNPNAAEGFAYRFGQMMNKIELFPQSDELICLPSYLWHAVTPFPEGEERIAITFDICDAPT